jgi:membrane fusion protein (multidrug efflux system)
MPAVFSHTTRALARDSSGPALAAYALVGVALAAWLGWFFFGRVTVVEVSHEARLEVQQAAHALNAPVAGQLIRQAPPLGTEVRQGDVVLELDATALQLRLREEGSRREGLLAQVQALQQEILAREQAALQDRQAATAAVQGAELRAEEAGAAAHFAQDNERRLRAESEAGGVARVDALQAAADARRLASAQGALAADARRMAADGQTRISQQRAQVENLQRTLAGLQAEAATAATLLERLALEVDHHKVRAPVAGRIGEVAPLHAGETVAVGQKLVTIIPAGELIAVAEFDPAAVLGRVRPGQSAELRLDGFPWAQYGSVPATVTRVAGEIRDKHIRVEFAPHAGWPAGVQVQHGLPGTMEVTLEQVAPAVMVLRAAGQVFGGAKS